jgi:hypothetical protein
MSSLRAVEKIMDWQQLMLPPQQQQQQQQRGEARGGLCSKVKATEQQQQQQQQAQVGTAMTSAGLQNTTHGSTRRVETHYANLRRSTSSTRWQQQRHGGGRCPQLLLLRLRCEHL